MPALTIVTPATAAERRLTTAAAVRAELGLPASQDENLFEQLLDQASAAIVRHCRREFVRETVREALPGFGDIYLQLTRTPVVSITSVLQDSSPITDFDLEKSDLEAGLLYRRVGWTWTAQRWGGLSNDPIAGQEEPAFVVTYPAGYICPLTPDTRTLPFDVEKAAIETVKSWYQGRQRDPMVTMEGVDGMQLSYADSAGRFGVGDPMGIPPSAVGLLAPWRRAA